MGLNMPAKTVIFTAMQKWDGEQHRWMRSGEYIQMSGRAGRRGKDDRGICIMMIDKRMDATICKWACALVAHILLTFLVKESKFLPL